MYFIASSFRVSCTRRTASVEKDTLTQALRTSRLRPSRDVVKLLPMRKLQTQGVHHITHRRREPADVDRLLGGRARACRSCSSSRTSTTTTESHLYFDPGDGRLITVFTNEDREPDPTRTPTDPGCVHHLAFSLSQATFHQAVERLDERGIQHSGVKDRGFMDSIYFEDPLGLLIELASYRFEPPFGSRTPTSCSTRTSSASSAATTTSPRRISRTRSRRSSPVAAVALGRSRPRIPYS